jgi:tetratricopeptide (TPR) repeat protein
VAIFEEIGHDRYLNSALNNSGLVAMYLGQWDLAIERYRRAADHGERCGNTADRAIVEMNIGFLLFRQGHLDEAEEHARRSLRIFDVVGIPSSAASPATCSARSPLPTAGSTRLAAPWPRQGRRSWNSATTR